LCHAIANVDGDANVSIDNDIDIAMLLLEAAAMTAASKIDVFRGR